MHRSSIQRINMATEVLNDTIEELALIDIFRTLHQKNKTKQNKKTQSTHSYQVDTEHSLGFTKIGTKLGFPGGSKDKASACNLGDLGLIPGLGRSPGEGNGNPLQHSCLENPMDRGAWWVTVHGVSKSWT